MGGWAISRSVFLAIAALMLAGCQSTGLTAGSLGPDTFASRSDTTARDIIAASSAMPVGAETDAPSGFLTFCSRNPDQCRDTVNGEAVVSLDAARWQTLWDVNTAWNAAIKPLEDAAHYGRVDYWTIPTDGSGDCEDYALAKRKSLIDRGFPSQSLRIAMAQLPDGEAHAVLTVATDRGDYVLDNLHSAVLPWKAIGYGWIARQTASEKKWVSVGAEGNGGPQIIVARITR